MAVFIYDTRLDLAARWQRQPKLQEGSGTARRGSGSERAVAARGMWAAPVGPPDGSGSQRAAAARSMWSARGQPEGSHRVTRSDQLEGSGSQKPEACGSHISQKVACSSNMADHYHDVLRRIMKY